MAVIEPNKCIIEDLEILAFESEEQLNFYTIWHEALVDKRRELNAVSDRERQIIRNEIARKTRQLISLVGGYDDANLKGSRKVGKTNVTSSGSSSSNGNRRTTASKTGVVKITNRRSPTKSATTTGSSLDIPTASSARRAPSSSNSALAASRRAIAAAVAFRPTASSSAKRTAQNQSFISQQPIGQRLSPTLPNGLTILNSSYFNTMPNGKQMMKYKLTKLYNKYRGRQVRRNLVNDKQRNARIEVEINRSYLNSWLTYTALQALRLPETNINSLNATTINSSQILTPFAQANHQYTTPSPMPVCMPPQTPSPAPKKKTKPLSKKQQKLLLQQQQQQQNINITNPQQQQQFPQKPPLHLVYIDPGNIITYSNRINPQQVAEYKQKSHLLPSSATSKKSSAASYDVFEIMEVLANTNKTNVTITRNANRPAVAAAAAAAAASGSQNSTSSSTASSSATTPGSIYSHSVNANTPGIVSTQLHLQARSYIDIMSKLYAEEIKLIEEEKKSMLHGPSTDEIVRRYLNVDYNIENSFDSTRSQGSLNSNENCSTDSAEHQLICSSSGGGAAANGSLSDQEDELEMLEEDIKSMLNVNQTTPAAATTITINTTINGSGGLNIININGSGDQQNNNQMNELKTPLTQEML